MLCDLPKYQRERYKDLSEDNSKDQFNKKRCYIILKSKG